MRLKRATLRYGSPQKGTFGNFFAPGAFFLLRATTEKNMTMTVTLAPLLPHLRRYARALTGSQKSGDAHVRAALSALVTDEN